jgi:hypothetical protein
VQRVAGPSVLRALASTTQPGQFEGVTGEQRQRSDGRVGLVGEVVDDHLGDRLQGLDEEQL